MSVVTKIFKNLQKERVQEIYLDIVSVVPRKDFKRHFELVEPKKYDKIIYELLDKLLPLPKLSNAAKINSNSLILDIAVSDYQTGSGGIWSIGDYLFFWRPKIQLRSRLYRFDNKEIVAEYRIKKNLPWKYWFNRGFSIENTLNSGIEDTQVLLYKAIEELKNKIYRNFL